MLKGIVRLATLRHAISPRNVRPGQVSLISLRCNPYSSAITERRKFYEDVSISQGEGGLYEINLDRRKLKTPGGKLFTVPNEPLAIAVATEWDAQKDTLKFYTMHMTTL